MSARLRAAFGLRWRWRSSCQALASRLWWLRFSTDQCWRTALAARVFSSAARLERKQRVCLLGVWSGSFFADLVGIVDEGATTVAREFKPIASKTVQLMEPVFERGHRVMPRPTLAEARERVMNGLTTLDARYKTLRRPAEFPVRQTAALSALVISEKLRAQKRQD